MSVNSSTKSDDDDRTPTWGGDLVNTHATRVVSAPIGDSMDSLCRQLSDLAHQYKSPQDWPRTSLRICADAGVYRWFLPATQDRVNQGGMGWSEADQVRAYLRLAAADLTTTFVITQFMGACKRIATSDNPVPRDRYMQSLLSGRQFATVGISHLTTSRRHLGKPVLLATENEGGYSLHGVSPWVTGAPEADVIVVAATMEDGRELLAAVPTTANGIECGPGAELVALSASCTDQVAFTQVHIDHDMVIAGPMHAVMKSGTIAGTGGLQTSTLAAGLSRAAVDYLRGESEKRADLVPIAEHLNQELLQLCDDLISAAGGGRCDAGEIRGRANRLVMRTTQAAMSAAKGAGYVASHPVGRWCREALFFLVWSCPTPVAQGHMCELAGIDWYRI